MDEQINQHKRMAMGGGQDTGTFGIDPLSSHMGAAARPHPSNPPHLPDEQRGHKGHHRRTAKASLDGDFNQGGADHGPYSGDRIPPHV